MDFLVKPPRQFGLFSQVAPVQATGDELRGKRFWAAPCGRGEVWDDVCPTVDEKQFSSMAWVETVPVVVSSGVECVTAGVTDVEVQTAATNELIAGEEAQIEQFIVSMLPTATGDAVEAGEAIGQAEAALPGVIWVSRDLAPALIGKGLLVVKGGRVVTGLGTPVVVVGGSVEFGIAWSGLPYLWRGDIQEAGVIDRGSNLRVALAERVYGVTLDAACVVEGALNVTVASGGGTPGPKGDKGDKGDTGAKGAKGDKGDPGIVQAIVAGDNVTVDNTDPANPVVNATGGGGLEGYGN